MKTIRQITKVIMTDAKITVACITNGGTSVAFGFDLKDKPEMKKLVEEFATKLLPLVEKEIQ